MLKNKLKLESIINNRVGHFVLDNDCPLEIAEQMLTEFMQYLGKIKEQAKAQQDQKKNEEQKPVEDKIEQIG